MHIQRVQKIENNIQKGKVLVIYGARQVGKTTLIKEFLKSTDLKYKFVTGDDLQIGIELSKCTSQSTINFVGDYDLIIIDEAQRIENIGLALKLMVDMYPEKYFIATGSSSFDLASQTSESLTGRKKVMNLYTISQQELLINSSRTELINSLESYLIYGSYPEVILTQEFTNKEKVIREISNSYLLKDVLGYEGIKNSKIILDILKNIAFQIGSEVSTVEIAKNVGVDYKTVIKYLDLLEKSFILFTLSGFSRNLRKEVNKMQKYYFTDLGVRNYVISNFNRLSDRDDIGKLWENFLMVERRKYNINRDYFANYYFWRTYDQQEIDLIEEGGGKLFGYEFKWSNNIARKPKLWLDTYTNSSFQLINRENYLDFVV